MLKRKHYIILIFIIIMAIAGIKSSHIFAQPHLFTRVEEEDGSPSVSATKLKVSNSTLTDNGDGSVSLSTTTLPSLSLTGNLTIDKHRPFIYFDPNSGDTQWYEGVLSDANGVSDDPFIIGTGTDPNSNAKFIIDSSGNVGIGTSSPNVKLHIYDSSQAKIEIGEDGSGRDILRLESNAASYKLVEAVDVGNTYRDLYLKANNLTLYSGASVPSERIIIKNTGNVGIGTTSPDALLHIEKSTALTNTQQEVIRISATTTGIPVAGFGAGMGFELETDANSSGHMELMGGIYGIIEDPTLDSEDGAAIIKTMTGGAAATEKMRINSSGGMVLQGSFNYGIDAEATDAYVIDLDPNLSVYTDGLIVYWNPNNPNTGACTLRLTGGLAIKNIKTQGGDDPPDNYIEAGTTSRPGAMFNSTADCWVLITPDANP